MWPRRRGWFGNGRAGLLGRGRRAQLGDQNNRKEMTSLHSKPLTAKFRDSLVPITSLYKDAQQLPMVAEIRVRPPEHRQARSSRSENPFVKLNVLRNDQVGAVPRGSRRAGPLAHLTTQIRVSQQADCVR